MPKKSGYVKTFKVKEGEKHKSYKLMSSLTGNKKLLEKYKTILTKVEDLRKYRIKCFTIL